jgi:hypothetical protein
VKKKGKNIRHGYFPYHKICDMENIRFGTFPYHKICDMDNIRFGTFPYHKICDLDNIRYGNFPECIKTIEHCCRNAAKENEGQDRQDR